MLCVKIGVSARKSVQGCAKVCKDVQGCARVCVKVN